MAAVIDEVCQLTKDMKYELAAKTALENWGRLTNLEPQERHTLLTTTHPQEQTILWTAILINELEQHMINWSSVLPYISRYTNEFDVEQIRKIPQMFCQFFHIFADSLCTNRKAIMGVAIVADAINRFAPTENTLTSIHSDLIQLCLAARCLKPCLPFLERDYSDLYTDCNQFECQKVVQFFYYGGMVYCCLHDYLKAIQCLTICLCVPAVSISAVMLAAYKKYILISLLRYGKLVQLPRCSHDLVERIMKNPARQYVDLAKCYTSSDQTGTKKILTECQDLFIADGNYGLVQRVMTQMSHHAVQRLTMSFLKLPLADAAQRIELKGAEEMEKMIRDMIEAGEVNATISQVEKRVEFHDDCTTGGMNPANVQMLDQRLRQCIGLQEQLARANRQLSTDPRYIQKSGGGSSGLGLGLGSGLSGLEDDPLHEEHLL